MRGWCGTTTPRKGTVSEMAKKHTKQVIVMRTDTNPPMRKGKMVAQGAHAALAFLTRRVEQFSMKLPEQYMKYGDFDWRDMLGITPAMWDWMQGSYAKVCVRVDSIEDLMDIHQKAKQAGLEVHMITDSGKTEFKEPTVTCLAIGPDYDENIDPVTGHLKLL